MKYPRCESEEIIETIMDSGPHHGRRDCSGCGKFIAWIPKPDSENRPAQHKSLIDKFSKGFCELCLRWKSELPKPQTLHAHHVSPFADAGEPTRENTWILCTHCHRLVEMQRTYIGHYRQPKQP